MRVALSKNAQKQYQRLPKTEQIKVRKKLTAILQNPQTGKKLEGELRGIRSLKVWPYRILYEINEKEKMVSIHKIIHRQGAYK